MDPAHSIRAIAIPLALAVCIGSLLPVTAQAASTSSTIDVDDTSMTWGNGWTWRPDDDNQSIGTFTVADGADVTLTGTTTQNRVLITGVATIRLADASIDVSGISDPAFRLDPGADLTLLLSGVNTIRGGGQNAGIYVPPDTSITIDSASAADDEIGVLHAYAGAADGAGIGGGGSSEANSPITINGGEVNATGASAGASAGAGIGGGGGGAGGVIVINGGTVNATGGSKPGTAGGAGIGGGSTGAGGQITINAGVIHATGGVFAAGIGGGSGGAGGTIDIDGGIVIAGVPHSTGDPAAIGGGSDSAAGTITIDDAVVIALAGMASIGSGSTSSDGTITIAGSTVIGLSHHGDEYGIGLTEGGAVDTTINTDSIVFASGANGVESNGATGILLGTDVTIDDDAQTISLGADLTVPTGATLTVPPGWTLTINGHTLTNAGAIENHGTIAGTVTGTPAITVIPTASITMASTTVPWTGDGHPLTASVDPGEANTYEFAYTYEGVGDTDYSTSSTPPTDLGTYLVRATLTAPAGFSGSRKARLTIAPWTQAPLTLTGVPEVIRYGDSFTIGTLGGSGSGAVTYSVTETVTEPDPESGTEPERGPVVATIDPATGDVDVVEVGAFEVVATKAGSGAYAEATASAALIAVKALAPAIELPTYANPISYGAPLAASILDVPAGPTYGWFDWTDPWVMPTVAQSGEEFSIAFTPFDETTAHYEPVSDLTASMPVTVLPCDVIVTATGQNKAYDGTTAADVVLTPVGLVGDDVVTATGTGTFADPDVGEGKTVTVTDIVLGGKDGGNYQALAGMRPITANITPRPVTVVWSGTDLTYTGSPLAPSAEFTDVLDAVVPLTVTGQQTNVAASAYTATAVPPASGNYTLVNPTVEFTITEASTSPTTPPTTPSAPPTDPSTPPTTPPTTPSAPPADPSTPPTTPPTTPSTPPTTPPTDPPVAHPAAVSRFGVSFTSVVVRVGATVNVPVEVYRAAGTEPGHAQVTWTSSSPGTASVTTGKKSGTLSWNVGQAESLKVRAHRTGRATIRVTAPGARPLTVVVKAVPKARSVGVERLAIAAKRFASADDSNGFADALKSASAPIRVAAGKSVELKTWVYPLGALRSAGEWRSSKPAVAIVDAVGRVTAIAKGTTTITCEVGGTKARKTVIVT